MTIQNYPLHPNTHTHFKYFVLHLRVARDAAHLLAFLPSIYGALNLIPSHMCKPGMVAHLLNLKVQVEGSKVQGHPWLCAEFEADRGYVRPYKPNQITTKH